MTDTDAVTDQPLARREPAPWWTRFELVILLGAGIGFFLFRDSLAFLTTIVIYAILALSYSYIYGQAGIASMGHATLYGVSSYAVAILSSKYVHDPLLGLAAGAIVGAGTAWLTSWLFITATRLALAMLTIAVAQVFMEIANKAVWLTKGDDGFTGYEVPPLLGLFRFDMYGATGFWYSISVLLLVYWVLQKIVSSHFGARHQSGCGACRIVGWLCTLPPDQGVLHFWGRCRGGGSAQQPDFESGQSGQPELPGLHQCLDHGGTWRL